MHMGASAGRSVAVAVTKYRNRRESQFRYVVRPLAVSFSGKVLATAVHLFACELNYHTRFLDLLFLLADRSGLKLVMAVYTTLDCLFHGFAQQKDTQR